MEAPDNWDQVFTVANPAYVKYTDFRHWWLSLPEETGKEYLVSEGWEKYRIHLSEQNIKEKLEAHDGSTQKVE